MMQHPVLWCCRTKGREWGHLTWRSNDLEGSSAHGTYSLFLTSDREKLRFTLVAWLQSTGVNLTLQTCADIVLTRRPSNNGLHYKRVRICWPDGLRIYMRKYNNSFVHFILIGRSTLHKFASFQLALVRLKRRLTTVVRHPGSTASIAHLCSNNEHPLIHYFILCFSSIIQCECISEHVLHLL